MLGLQEVGGEKRRRTPPAGNRSEPRSTVFPQLRTGISQKLITCFITHS